ncbi:MAG: TIGR02757 family protein [Myxococcales bacterium]|nr:TIGR02757 family protein [Myxococcales bacterium]
MARDPLAFPRRYEGLDREVVAVLSALLAFGRVAIIRAKIEALLGLLGPRPSETVAQRSREALQAHLRGFRHRTFAGEDLAGLLTALGTLQRRDGSVFASLRAAFAASSSTQTALSVWVQALQREAWPEGLTRARRHLLPDPAAGSAAKRLLLLMRWVSRPDDGVDLGLSVLPPRALLFPVDVHIHRIAKNLGLTRRNDASWQTAVEITDALRSVNEDDPVALDLSLCHLGISGRCPSRRDDERCGGCALQSVCIHWQ